MIGAAVELEPDMNSSLVAGGIATDASTSSLRISIIERAADLTVTADVSTLLATAMT